MSTWEMVLLLGGGLVLAFTSIVWLYVVARVVTRAVLRTLRGWYKQEEGNHRGT